MHSSNVKLISFKASPSSQVYFNTFIMDFVVQVCGVLIRFWFASYFIKSTVLPCAAAVLLLRFCVSGVELSWHRYSHNLVCGTEDALVRHLNCTYLELCACNLFVVPVV